MPKTLSHRMIVAAPITGISIYFTDNPGQTAFITVAFNHVGAIVYYGFERLREAVQWSRSK